MEMPVLPAQLRDMNEKAKRVRASGQIPAVYYGGGKENLHLKMDYQTFRRVFAKAGESTVLELQIDNKKIPVLVYDVQFNPLNDLVSHVDFHHVDMNKEVTAKVPVKTVGVSEAVKTMGGILTVHKPEITIRCLPKDLIHEIEVDISPLADFHISLHIKDLKIPSMVKVMDNPEDTVANVRPMRIEVEEPVAAATPAEGVAPVAGAEGAAVAPAAGAPADAKAAAPAKEEKKK